MSGKKDEPSSRHICVSWCPTCCSNLWEHLRLQHEGTFITSLLSRRQESAGRRISMRHSGHTSRRTPRSGTFDASASHAEDGQCWHQDAATLPSLLSTCQQRRRRGTIQDCKITVFIRLRWLTSGEDAHRSNLCEKNRTTTC